jgi:hypothetical protein
MTQPADGPSLEERLKVTKEARLKAKKERILSELRADEGQLRAWALEDNPKRPSFMALAMHINSAIRLIIKLKLSD